jgi:tRNA (guanine37-N1)-methyltransferase
VEKLSREQRLVLLCGRYEGFDERVAEPLKPDAISIGDYILNGGEVAAMTIVDAVIRHVPGVLGDEESAKQDSFSGEQRHLESAQYTRPREFRGLAVPEVLIGGNHEQIAAWRAEEGRRRTEQRMKNAK